MIGAMHISSEFPFPENVPGSAAGEPWWALLPGTDLTPVCAGISSFSALRSSLFTSWSRPVPDVQMGRHRPLKFGEVPIILEVQDPSIITLSLSFSVSWGHLFRRRKVCGALPTLLATCKGLSLDISPLSLPENFL